MPSINPMTTGNQLTFKNFERVWSKFAKGSSVSTTRWGLFLPILIAVGCLYYFQLSEEPTAFSRLMAGAITLSCIILAVSAQFFQIFPRILAYAIMIIGCLGFGFTISALRTQSQASAMLDYAMDPTIIEGWITKVEPSKSNVRLRIKIHAIGGLAPEYTPKFIRITHRSDLQAGPGRFVRCWGSLRPPPNPSLPGDYAFRRQAYFQQLGAVGFTMGPCKAGSLSQPPSFWTGLGFKIAAIRHELANHIVRTIDNKAAGFAAALISGDRSHILPEHTENLRKAGLAHLLAISGLHMGLITGLAYFLVWRCLALIEPLSLRFPIQKVAAILALFLSLIYLIISGASVSAQRAFIMSAVFLGGILLDRPAITLNALALAMCIVLILAPESILSPGFQMSFAATAGSGCHL